GAIAGNLSLYENNGSRVVYVAIQVPALSGLTLTDMVPSGFEGYAVVESGIGADSETLIGFETYRNLSDIAFIRALPEAERLRRGYMSQLASQGGYSTRLMLVNFGDQVQQLRITAEALEVAGNARTPSSVTVERRLLPNARLEEPVEQMFNLTENSLIGGYIRFETEGDTSGVFGVLDYGTTDGVILTAVEAQGNPYSDLFFSFLAEGSGYYTGLALFNPNDQQSVVTLDIFNRDGSRTSSMSVNLRPREHKA